MRKIKHIRERKRCHFDILKDYKIYCSKCKEPIEIGELFCKDTNHIRYCWKCGLSKINKKIGELDRQRNEQIGFKVRLQEWIKQPNVSNILMLKEIEKEFSERGDDG